MESKKDKVWGKGKVIRGRSPDTWRRDSEGNPIRYGSYGTTGTFGWEIDHSKPLAKGGGDSLRNLEPLQWEANRKKADKYSK